MFKLKTKKTNKESASASKSQAVRFIPNFGHFQSAIRQLPRASDHPDDTISIFIQVDNKLKEMAFVKKRIQRGSKFVDRWTFEGKLLLREQDIESLK